MTQMPMPQMDDGEMKGTEFMSAAEKRKVLRHWVKFLESGLAKDNFTKSLYNHLIMHCSFIAHYDINGFYDTYFTAGDDTNAFLSQFDQRNATELGRGGKYVPKSIEYGMTCWATDSEYGDINQAMISLASPHIDNLLQHAGAEQKKHDLQLAQSLLRKHGYELNIK